MSTEQVQLADGEWFVVFYPQTAATRLHPSVDAARRHVSQVTVLKDGYRAPLDLKRAFDHPTLERFWRELFERADQIGWPRTARGPLPAEAEREPPDLPTEDFCRELWALMQRVGDRVLRGPSATRSRDHYTLDLVKLRDVSASEELSREYPKQCRVVVAALAKLDNPYVTERELQSMMTELVARGQLRTKQDPWLIMQFYRSRLVADGLLTRGDQQDSETEE